MKLEKLSGVELGSLVNKREISPTEVIKYFCDRIEKYDGKIHAFTYRFFDDAIEEAKKLEDRMLHEYVGPLCGVPIALKDFLPSKKGWPSSHGGVPAMIQIDDEDSEFYKAAKSLGAIAIGKTNAPAFGFSGKCKNMLFGETLNPFNTQYTSGGSSGGSAAAIAAGLITIAEGGDAGGSIRIPASWCNLYGYKPALGTVPKVCRPDGWSASHPHCFNGALTKTVEDSALLLNRMAYYNPRDPYSLPINSNIDFLYGWSSIEDLKGKRIAFTYDFGLYSIEPVMQSNLNRLVYKLRDAGAIVEEVEFNFQHIMDEILFCWAWAISIDTSYEIEMLSRRSTNPIDLLRDHYDELPDEFIYFNEIAHRANIHDFKKFNDIKTDILDNFEDVFQHYDYILSPTTTCPPIEINGSSKHSDTDKYRSNPMFDFLSFGLTPLANFVGYPAASVPVGLSDNNLPIGVQIIGKQYHDKDVIDLSQICEKINPWRDNYNLSLDNIKS